MAGKQSSAMEKAQAHFMTLRGKGMKCKEINMSELARVYGVSNTTFYKAQWYKDEIELDRKEGK